MKVLDALPVLLSVAALAMILNSTFPGAVHAEERAVSADELRSLVVGKRIVDTNRDDHWVTFADDGTAVGSSRGREFDMSYQIEEGGWCRQIKPRGGSSSNAARYRKCQDIKYDGKYLYFYDKDGSLASKYTIE